MKGDPIWVVADPEAEDCPDVLAVHASSAESAARLAVGPGPYAWADLPTAFGAGLPHEQLEVPDNTGRLWPVVVWGPF